MSCKCKVVNNGNDIDSVIKEKIEGEKLTFFKKLDVSLKFIEFYFYFVVTSVINLMLNDKLEPNIPSRLIKKYNNK